MARTSSDCLGFAQLVARGVSVLFSSSDSGVGAGDCKLADGTGNIRSSLYVCLFIATFPVTSVGGTTSRPIGGEPLSTPGPN